MLTTLYLEQLLGSMESLPSELQRTFQLMREVDLQLKGRMETLQHMSDKFVEKMETLPASQREKQLKIFKDEFARLMELSEEKLQIASQSYDTVDKHIQQIDKDLRNFEEEARQGSKVPNTYTEAEDEYLKDLPVDPNEPTYCICNSVSYGEMVACENPNCPIEWFHFACVDLVESPKGKWYCPQCRIQMSSVS